MKKTIIAAVILGSVLVGCSSEDEKQSGVGLKEYTGLTSEPTQVADEDDLAGGFINMLASFQRAREEVNSLIEKEIGGEDITVEMYQEGHRKMVESVNMGYNSNALDEGQRQDSDELHMLIAMMADMIGDSILHRTGQNQAGLENAISEYRLAEETYDDKRSVYMRAYVFDDETLKLIEEMNQ